MIVMGVFLRKVNRASQSPARIRPSEIVLSDAVVGGGVQRRLLFSALDSIKESNSAPPFSVIPAKAGIQRLFTLSLWERAG